MKTKRGIIVSLIMMLMLSLFRTAVFATEEPVLPDEEESSYVSETETEDYAWLDEAERQKIAAGEAEIIPEAQDEQIIESADLKTPAEITAAADPASVLRFNVLILDTSGSMSGTPATVQKQAAVKFCESLMQAQGTNYVAVVQLNSSSSIVCDFTSDLALLVQKINAIGASGGTNINDSLLTAKKLMDPIAEQYPDAIKNIVLCSDGIPEHGTSLSTGPYTSSDSAYYGYANAAYATALSIREDDGYSIYSLGFFHSLSGTTLEFGRRVLTDLSNGEGFYYEVEKAEDLEFVFGEIAEDIATDNSLKEIKFTYQSGSDYEATCYYTNTYFGKKSNVYNPSLATMSLSFAMSAFGSGKVSSYENKSVNAVNLLKEIGVEESAIRTNEWFEVKPTTDSIAVIAGSMPVRLEKEKFTLIALAVRGGGYEREWASNFTLGRSGLHDGFEEARNNVISFLREYVSEMGITGKVKFWLTGYSRAAATANLVGGELDNGTFIGDGLSFSKDDVYVYTFETPAGILKSDITSNTSYNNIFNIMNLSDPVPYLAPAAMGFGRYGIDRYLPSAASTPSNYNKKLKNMLEVYYGLDSTDIYVVDDFKMKKVAGANNWLPGGKPISPKIVDDPDNPYSQGVYLSNYVTIISKEFLLNRDYFVDHYQNEIREICSVVFGCSDSQSKKLMESIEAQAKDQWGDVLKSYFWNVGVKGESEEKAMQIVSDWLFKAIKDAGITDYDANMVDSAGKELGNLILLLLVNHPNYLSTAIENASCLASAHYPELCWSWLVSMDPNYNEDAQTSFNNGGYRIIHINCAVDVTVYDTEGNVVAMIVDEQSQDVGTGILSGVDENGQKIVILPNEADYTIEITGRESDLVNYGISEYSAKAGEFTRNVNYFDIPIEKDEVLSGTVPAYSAEEIENDTVNGSEAEYTLTDPVGEEIVPSTDMIGEEAAAAYYTVTAESSNDEWGVTIGSGTYQFGQFARLEAVARPGYEFVGWQQNGVQVSEEEVYRVRVDEDVDLVGVFKEDTRFKDVRDKSKYYFNPVYWAKDAGITKGYAEDNTFRPQEGCTRAQMVTFLWRMAGKPEPTANAKKFPDVKSNQYYYKAVLWAAEKGITKGYADGTFKPDTVCLREHAVTFLYRYAGVPELTVTKNPFNDIKTSDYYYKAAVWANENGIAKGYSSGEHKGGFGPKLSCLREHIVTFLYRYAY